MFPKRDFGPLNRQSDQVATIPGRNASPALPRDDVGNAQLLGKFPFQFVGHQASAVASQFGHLHLYSDRGCSN